MLVVLALLLVCTGLAAPSLTVAGAALFLYGFLSRRPSISSLGAGDASLATFDHDAAGRLLRWLVPLPLAIVALAATRTLPGTLFLETRGRDAMVLFVPLLFVILALVFVATWTLRASVEALSSTPPATAGRIRLAFLVTLAALIAIGTWWFPRPVGTALGSVALIGVLGAVVGLVLHPVARAGIRTARGVLRLVGFRRVPAFTLLVVWLVAAAVLDRHGGFHDARLLEGTEARAAMTLEDALAAWYEANVVTVPGAPSVAGASSSGRRTVPLVFVATAGGAARSAYWTSLVFDCLFEESSSTCNRGGAGPIPRESVIVASGISGGSVGLATSHALRDEPKPRVADNDVGLQGRGERVAWYDQIYGNDLLAPVIARLLFVDLPNGFFHFNFFRDRAAVLEESLESATDGVGTDGLLEQGLFESAFEKAPAPSGPRLPILLLNGASVEDGCRLNGSGAELAAEPVPNSQKSSRSDKRDAENAEADSCLAVGARGPQVREHTPALAGTRDLRDFSCPNGSGRGKPRDVRLSTAALLSARFPYVTPSGALHSCTNKEDRTFIVDGGIIDSSAAAPVVELLAAVQPAIDRYNAGQASICVVPVLLQLDNGYTELSAPSDASRPWELLAPMLGALHAAGAQADHARQAAALAFSAQPTPWPPTKKPANAAYCDGAKPIPRYVQLAPAAHPGVESAMGWTLSDQSRRDLLDQLKQPENSTLLEIVRRCWFDQPATAAEAATADLCSVPMGPTGETARRRRL
ncbi:MAG: hypothetical protein ACRD0Q_00535 [Acidimicrobiales bacterium]